MGNYLSLDHFESRYNNRPNDETCIYDWSNVRDPALLTILFAAMYSATHLAFDRLVIRRVVDAELLSKLGRSDAVYLREKVCSSLNALITGVSGLALLLSPQSSYTAGTFSVFQYYPKALHYLLSSYCGYSIYDMMAMIYAGDKDVAMWLHHLIGLAGAFMMMLYRTASYFPTAFLVSELTVLPTNLVWLLKTIKYDRKSLLFRLAHGCRTLGFVTLRTFIAPVTVWFAVKQCTAGWSEFWEEFGKLPWLVSVGTAINVCLLGGLNLFWTLMVGRGMLLKAWKTRKELLSKTIKSQ